nr:hypothetical protein [Tanacetum cinerariifolium]GFA69391.1 hypothetical protein [Tanacetum cinerariifolium]
MVPGVCWEVMEGHGGVVRRRCSGAEMGEVVLQGLAGNGVNWYSVLNVVCDREEFFGILHSEFEAPEEAPQSPEQAPPSPDYVSGPEHPLSPVLPVFLLK